MSTGKIFIILGFALVAIGAALTWAPWLVNWFGRLPGDLRIEKEGSGFYFPVTSMLIVNVALTIILNLFFRR